MADSDNTTTLSLVTRRKAMAERTATAFAPNSSEDDPATVLWGQWQASHTETDRLCRHAQRIEADLVSGAGREIEYEKALQAESAAGEEAMDLLELLSETPASSLGGVAAKLDAVLGEGQPSENDGEFPWPLIRSVLEDIIRIGQLAGPDAEMGESVTLEKELRDNPRHSSEHGHLDWRIRPLDPGAAHLRPSGLRARTRHRL